jgi:glyoxylase-like metal-dependent hydrolase (beta-lactamase superfamily II)
VTTTRTLRSQLAAAGFAPADVTFVALSHYHYDHTANANLFAASTWLVRPVERDASGRGQRLPLRHERPTGIREAVPVVEDVPAHLGQFLDPVGLEGPALLVVGTEKRNASVGLAGARLAKRRKFSARVVIFTALTSSEWGRLCAPTKM